MSGIAVYMFINLLKLFLYIILLFIAFVITLKIWLQPVKGVCKCKVRLDNKVALVTGGNTGIGLETARGLARRGARVIIASRNDKRSEGAVKDIIQTTGNAKVEYRHLDLSKFESIKKFADNFNKNVDRLDILVNNAGCAGLKQRLTENGIDLVMQINYVGPFLLTTLLMEKLIESKPSRIVIVSSYMHHFAKFDSDDLAGVNTVGYWQRYANSKLCNVLWARALSTRIPEGVTANVLHPGVVQTDIFNKLPPKSKQIVKKIIDMIFKTPEEGAQTSIHLSVSPDLEDVSGEYFAECRRAKVSPKVLNDDLVEKVWSYSIKLIKNTPAAAPRAAGNNSVNTAAAGSREVCVHILPENVNMHSQSRCRSFDFRTKTASLGSARQYEWQWQGHEKCVFTYSSCPLPSSLWVNVNKA